MSPTTAGLPAPKSKAVQLGVLGALGVLWGVLKGSVEVLPCPPILECPASKSSWRGWVLGEH